MTADSTLVADVFGRDPTDSSIAVVDGYGVRLHVERGHLVILDGVGPHIRTRRYSRAKRELRRILILGHVGTVSLEVLAWCDDIGVTLTVVSRDGRLLATTPRGIDDARLRRVQAVAAGTGTGNTIARSLIGAKITGQHAVLMAVFPTASTQAGALEVAVHDAEQAVDMQTLRQIEATAAATYWSAWYDVEIPFAISQRRRVHDHWTAGYTGRGSTITQSGTFARRATHPINAILNYGYALAEAECRYATAALGLDPGLGFLHTDEPGRDSFVLDLLEPVRPSVDRYVLALLHAHAFRASDFTETRDGVCRINPPLTHLLAEQAGLWARAAAPWAEAVAHALARVDRRIPARTPLTRRRQRDATQLAGRRPAPGEPAQSFAATSRSAARPRARIERTCATCGGPLPKRNRKHCDNCLPGVRRTTRATFADASRRAAETRLVEGRPHPQHSPEAAAKRAVTLKAIAAVNRAWEREHPDAPRDPAVFAGKILPRLQAIPVGQIAQAAGITRGHASRIRRGLDTPHPRHWQVLRQLAADRETGADYSRAAVAESGNTDSVGRATG